MNYKTKLREVELRFYSLTKLDEIDDRKEGPIYVNDIMQRYYPGPYKVVEEYDINRGVFGFKLKFSDPKEELLWILRWS